VLSFSGHFSAQDVAAKLAVLFAEGNNVRMQIEAEIVE
jgi:hypothetical protein